MRRALPRIPRGLLRTTANHREHSLVDALHRWLDQQQLTVAELTPDRLRRFLAQPRRARVSRRVRGRYENWLRGYLQWLHDRAVIDFAPAPPRRPAPELPPLARAFLASLAPTHRPRTCEAYIYALRRLHGWLASRGLELERLTRSELAPWLQELHAAGLRPSSRRHILVDVRAYLHWRSEHGRMRTAPDELIRRSDFPKLPQYLPRPLTADADRELQHRLGRSTHPAAWALLLMRRTGLRLGELRGLEYHCVRSDGRCPLLKVPLGKLHNERLVPIDADSVELIRRLQSIEPRSRVWLVPGSGGAPMSADRLRRVLERHSHGLADPARITSHRLRHTYATEMLSAGMSLLGVMRLLGHHDHRMTLRYTAITPETVGDEYARALDRLATKYRLPARPLTPEQASDPDELLDHLSRWLRKHASSRQPLRALLKRIERLRHELASLRSSAGHKP
jgi:site-specific recombinase XerD